MVLDLNSNINKRNFKDYFHLIVNNQVECMINELNEYHTTYLFSGILRNYFLEYYGKPRDLDIVISRKSSYTNLEEILKKYGAYKLNAFGGFKLTIKDLSIDIWHIEDTWGIKNGYVKIINNSFEKAVLKSTFFNFSSILYDFYNNKFIYDNSFKEFYETKTVKIVLEENINYILCLINIIYYAEKYQLNLSLNIRKFFVKRFCNYNKIDFDEIQMKHFKYIKYEYSYLCAFYNNLNFYLNK